MRRRHQSGGLSSVALRYRHPLLRPRRPPGPPRRPAGDSLPGLDTPRVRPTGPYARDADLARLEAVLFIAREPLGSRKVAQLASLADGTQARTLVRKLNRCYDQEGNAFRVEEVAGGLQLLSRPQFARWLRRIQPRPVEVRLSAPALETLAVVAYRQPVLRAEVEAVRGVQCGDILRQLIERDLVRIAGRSDELGRPLLYGTTKRFLQVFGLRNLDELPRADLVRAEPQSAETSAPLASDTDIGQPTPNVTASIEEKEVTTLIAEPSTEPELATTLQPQLDDLHAEVDDLDGELDEDELDDEEEYEDEGDEDEDGEEESGEEESDEEEGDEEEGDEEEGDEEDDDEEDEEEYEEDDEEDEEEGEEDEYEDDDFEDEEWEEVEDDEGEEEEEEEEEDWEEEDWGEEDWDEDDEDEEEEEVEEDDEDY